MGKDGLPAEKSNLYSASARNGRLETDGEGRGRIKVTTKRSGRDLLSHTYWCC